MAKTIQFNVNSVTFSPVTVQTPCVRVVVYEDDQAGTTDYLLAAPTSGDTAVKKPAGAKKEFTAPSSRRFQPGDILGYIKSVAGSITFSQEEEGA